MAIDARHALAYPSGVMSETSFHPTSFVPCVVPMHGADAFVFDFFFAKTKRVWRTRRRPTD